MRQNLAPSAQQLGVFITGVPRYRASVPYLAYATAADLRRSVEMDVA